MMDIQKILKNVNIEAAFKHGMSVVKDNLPVIFSVSAVGCLGMSVYETAKATHKSDKDIAEEEARRAAELPLYNNTELSTAEKVELCWRNYIKAGLYTGACIFFIVAAERKGNEKYMALLSAYELTRKAGEERKDAEVDILGEEKAREIETEVRQRMVKSVDPSDDNIQDVATGGGKKTLFLEPYTNTPFWATYEDVLHAFNYVNYKKNQEGAASINDFLEALDLRQMQVAADWGWNEDQQLVEPALYDSDLVDEDPSKPATLVKYSVEPSQDYGNDKRQW